MLDHDDYGKRTLRAACRLANDSVSFVGSRQLICEGVTCDVDAVLDSGIAVEIESRVNKQVRGALLDLILHPNNKKLMILIPAHMGDASRTKRMCEVIVRKLKPDAAFACVVLKGKGGNEAFDTDAQVIAETIMTLLGNTP